MGTAAKLLERIPKAYDAAHEVALLGRWDVVTNSLPPITRTARSQTTNQVSDAQVQESSEPLIMCLPPPNLTGVLHLGHALTVSIQDAIARHARMCGRPVVWVPGFDHAGIAAQSVFERHLRSRGVTPSLLTREEFREQLGVFVASKREAISAQLRRLGATLSWPLTTYTMDTRFDEAVREAFVRLHSVGLVQRADRMVNWCPALRTVISDMEVEFAEVAAGGRLTVPGHGSVQFGRLFSVVYELEGGGELLVATTRPETMFGDVALLVHPEDARYALKVGRFARHPLTGGRLPVLADARVDRQFGTGVLKVTPAHDVLDQQLGASHRLPSVTILSEDGRIQLVGLQQQLASQGIVSQNVERFEGLTRFEARTRVLEQLAAHGQLRDVQDVAQRVPLCSRSGDVLEPRVTRQWFVDTRGLAQRAFAAVRSGQLRLVPARHEAVWCEFLGAKHRAWCVSRQLDWGHRVPAYQPVFAADVHAAKPGTNDTDADWIVARSAAEAELLARQRYGDACVGVRQSTDVLDTWFSSGLYPFAALGWPSWSLPSGDAWYPSTLLETGHDILFFWVARMTMLGLALTDKLPFRTVLLHGMVRDARGRKMSKSLGNVLDPLTVVDGASPAVLQTQLERDLGDKPQQLRAALANQRSMFPQGVPRCGADALRLTLLECDAQAESVAVNVQHATANRNFCNKLHQAVRFYLSRHVQLQQTLPPNDNLQTLLNNPLCSRIDRWVLAELANTVRQCDRAFQSYQLHHAAIAVRRFIDQRFCPLYLESTKPRSDTHLDHARFVYQSRVLHFCLQTSLALLHPLAPFVTERLHDALAKLHAQPQPQQSLMLHHYPRPVSFQYDNDADLAAVADCVEPLVRRVLFFCRTALNANALRSGVLRVRVHDQRVATDLAEFGTLICALTRVQSLEVTTEQNAQHTDTADERVLWIDADTDTDTDTDNEQQNIKIGIPINLEQLKTAASTTLPKAIRQQELLVERKSKKQPEVDVAATSQQDATTADQEHAKLAWLRSTHEAVVRLLTQ